MMSLVNDLLLLPVFNNVPRGDVAALAERLRVLDAKTGEEFISHLDDRKEIFFVLSGKVSVELYGLDGKLIELNSCGRGDILGELSAIDGQPRSASARAVAPSRLAVMEAGVFREALLGQGPFLMNFLSYLSAKIRKASLRTFEYGALNVDTRILCEIWRESRDGKIVGGEIVVDPAPTHETIAIRAATHREAVSRLFSRLQKDGLLRSGRGYFVVTRPSDLLERVSNVVELGRVRDVATAHALQP